MRPSTLSGTSSVRKIGGIEYYNTGDWVESCTAIVEHHDGAIELLRPHNSAPKAASADGAVLALNPA